MPPNIEKSAFKRGEYVGYAAGTVWRIRKTNSSYGNWLATPREEVSVPLYGHTLDDLSAKLARALKTA